MSDTGTVRHFMPPNTLRAKVPARGGLSLEEMQAAAEEALSKLEADSANWLQDDVARLTRHLSEAAQADPEALAGHVREISKIVHDLKSIAAQFQFPLIQKVGQSLGDFITADFDLATRRLDVIRVHVDAVVVILSNELTGDGGKAGEGLIAGLTRAVEKARAGQPAPA